jgi:hypothetical protein
MIGLAALALSFQVQVNVDVNRTGGSAGIAVRPSRERIAVTDEHRRTAFKDAAARDMLLRAREARLQQDSSLLSYDVKSYQRISAGMSLRETVRERLAFRSENAAHVQWHRATGARVEVLGARQAIPIVAGIKDAERDVEEEMRDEFSDMMAIPYYPGKDELWLFDMIGGDGGQDDNDDEDDNDDDMLIHPVAEGSEAYFTFASGDSVIMTLPDGKRITLREILVTPRQSRWNLVVGSFWFETDRAHLVRAVMRFSEKMDIWETAKAEDPTAQDDVPIFVRPLISPMQAEMTAVTIEYGLFNQRFWLPRTQGAEGYARVSFMRIPFKIEQRYRYESVNAIDSLPAFPKSTWVRSSVYSDSLKAAGLDSTAHRDAMRKFYVERDSLRREERKAQCETSGTYTQVTQRYNGSLPMMIEVPCDAKKLATSSELPPSIYDPGEELFGAKEREELMQALDFSLQPDWAPRAPTLEWGLMHTRYNRAEGFGSGAIARAQLGKGYNVALGGRASLADLQLNGDLTISRSNGRRSLHAGVYRRLDVSSDFGAPLSFGASLGAMAYARDEGFYHRAWGGELGGAATEGGGFTWRLFAEQQWNAPVETRWSLFGGANDDRFIGNVAADKGWLYGAALRLRGQKGLDPRGWRGTADLRLEGAGGDFNFGRAFLETTLSRGFGPLAASLTGAAGLTEGNAPAQRHFFLGGLQSVRGQTAGTGYGESFWLSRLEIGANRPAYRPVIFGDLGWAGARDAWGAMGRPMSGAGVGVSFLDGMFRFDLARGIYPRVQTRFDVSVEARF